MVRNPCGVGLGVLLALAGAGCSSSPPKSTPPATAAWGTVSPSLVMPGLGPGSTFQAGSAWPGGRRGWEYRRHDDRLSVGHLPPAAQLDYVQIETRDRLRIDNGRPREHSITRIHTIRQRLDR